MPQRMLLLILMMGLVLVPSMADTDPGAGEDSTPTSITWAPTFEAALAAAKRSGRPVLVDFGAEWCWFCKKMDREVLTHPTILKLATRFEWARVDTDERGDLASKYRVSGLPTYVFMDASGVAFFRSNGYLPPDPFGVRLRTALDIFQSQPRLAELKARRTEGIASPEELAELAHLLRRAQVFDLARVVAEEALEVLAEESAERSGVQLDLLVAGARTGDSDAATALKKWVATHTDHDRRWEASYELGLALANAGDLDLACRTLEEVADGAPETDWGIMARYYAGLIEAELNESRRGGG